MGRHRLGPPSAQEAEPPTDPGTSPGDIGRGAAGTDASGGQRPRYPGMVALRASLDFPNPEDQELGRRAAQWWHQHIKGLYTARGWTTDSVFNLDRIMRLPGTWNNRVPGERRPVEIIPRDSQALHTPRLPGPGAGGFSDLDPATGQDRTTEARTEPPGDQR